MYEEGRNGDKEERKGIEIGDGRKMGVFIFV